MANKPDYTVVWRELRQELTEGLSVFAYQTRQMDEFMAQVDECQKAMDEVDDVYYGEQPNTENFVQLLRTAEHHMSLAGRMLDAIRADVTHWR